MDTQQIVDSILESLREEVTEFVLSESKITSSSEYEEKAIELSRKFAVGLMIKPQGKMPKSRNLKKSADEFRQA